MARRLHADAAHQQSHGVAVDRGTPKKGQGFPLCSNSPRTETGGPPGLCMQACDARWPSRFTAELRQRKPPVPCVTQSRRERMLVMRLKIADNLRWNGRRSPKRNATEAARTAPNNGPRPALPAQTQQPEVATATPTMAPMQPRQSKKQDDPRQRPSHDPTNPNAPTRSGMQKRKDCGLCSGRVPQ